MSKGGVLRKLAIEVDLSGNGQEELADWNRKLAESRGLGKSFTSGIGEMERSMQAYKEKLGASHAEISRLGSALQGIAGLAVGSKIMSIGSAMIKSAADFETTAISFEVMLGSAEKAQKVLGDLNKFSIDTPFEPKEVNAAAQTLLQYKVAQESLLPLMTKIGDVASGTGKSYEDLARLMGKAHALNKVDNEMLQQAPVFYAELAKAMGKTETQIFEMASSGQIQFKHMEIALGSLTSAGGLFYQSMEKRSKSALGLWSTLMGNVDEMKKKVGLMILDAFKPLIDVLGRFVGWLVQSETAMTVVKIAVLALAPALAIFFAGVIVSLYKTAVALGVVQTGLIAALWPVYAIIAVIGLLALAIEDIYTWITGGDSLIGSWLGSWENVIGGIRDFFVSVFDWLLNAGKEYGPSIIMALFPLSMVYFFWDEIVAFFKSIPDRVVAALSGLKGLIPKLLAFILPPVLYTFVAKATGLDIEGRAGGGPVLSGTPYIVGEQGPELFVPSAAGSIIPNGALSGNSTITIAPVITINGSASRDDADTIASAVMKAIEDALPAVRAQLGLEAV